MPTFLMLWSKPVWPWLFVEDEERTNGDSATSSYGRSSVETEFGYGTIDNWKMAESLGLGQITNNEA